MLEVAAVRWCQFRLDCRASVHRPNPWSGSGVASAQGSMKCAYTTCGTPLGRRALYPEAARCCSARSSVPSIPRRRSATRISPAIACGRPLIRSRASSLPCSNPRSTKPIPRAERHRSTDLYDGPAAYERAPPRFSDCALMRLTIPALPGVSTSARKVFSWWSAALCPLPCNVECVPLRIAQPGLDRVL